MSPSSRHAWVSLGRRHVGASLSGQLPHIGVTGPLPRMDVPCSSPRVCVSGPPPRACAAGPSPRACAPDWLSRTDVPGLSRWVCVPAPPPYMLRVGPRLPSRGSLSHRVDCVMGKTASRPASTWKNGLLAGKDAGPQMEAAPEQRAIPRAKAALSVQNMRMPALKGLQGPAQCNNTMRLVSRNAPASRRQKYTPEPTSLPRPSRPSHTTWWGPGESVPETSLRTSAPRMS